MTFMRARSAAILIAGTMFVALGGCAGTTIINPSWASLPDAEAMGDAYPGFATAAGLTGSARVQCRSDLEGRLANCRAVKATPAGLGFDRAGLSLTPRFRLTPRQEAGEATKASVIFSIRFLLPDDATPEPWAGETPSAAALGLARTLASRTVEAGAAAPDPAELDVDEDRRAAVMDMIRRVDAEFLSRATEATALMYARTGTMAQLEAMVAGRRPPGSIPAEAVIEAASPELQTLSTARRTRLREVYCARYACPAGSRATETGSRPD